MQEPTSSLRQLPQIPALVEPHCQPTKEYPFVLMPKDLENSQNEYIVNLKNKEWTYTELNKNYPKDWSMDGRLIVNNKPLKSNQIEGYAKEFPLINVYAACYTQEATYFLDSSVAPNIEKAGLTIIHKNYRTNLAITKTSAYCITENEILMLLNYMDKPGQGRLFSIPGHFQSVYEVIRDPRPHLKLRAIKTSNSALQYLICNKVDSQYLEAWVKQAKKEESMESLYKWYKEQAKFFLSDKFYRDYNPPLDCDVFVKKFLLEVKIFLEGYHEPKAKYQEFIADVSLFFKTQSPDQDNIVMPVNNRPSKTECSIKHLFFLKLYALFKKGNMIGAIPLPLPTVGLDVDANLYIIIPREAIIFISTFKEYNNKLFNEVFNSKDENGNFMALFKHYSELKRFLVNCGMDPAVAKSMSLELYDELHQNKSWQQLVNTRSEWEKFMDEMAGMFGLAAVPKDVSDNLFKQSPAGRKLLEENWRKEVEKNINDTKITGPLVSNGIHKMSLMDILISKINFYYNKCCDSLSLDKSGLILNLKVSVPDKMRNDIVESGSIKYLNDGCKIKMTNHAEISQFIEHCGVSSKNLYAENKLDIEERIDNQNSCMQM